jgi:holo-[acyl-carrier protein] synthase
VIVGSGVDVVEIARLERVLARPGERFARRVFTAGEIEDCLRRGRPGPHFALRFAAKEAALKALGTGWGGGVGWRDVEVETDGAPGRVRLRLHGRAAELARERGRAVAHLAVAHCRSHALAIVLLEAAAR